MLKSGDVYAQNCYTPRPYCNLWSSSILKDIDRLLSIVDGQLLSYDTTFQLGDFYVSPLLFRNILISKFPVMPVAFLLHERKLKHSHEEMMKFIATEIPSLVNGRNIIPIPGKRKLYVPLGNYFDDPVANDCIIYFP